MPISTTKRRRRSRTEPLPDSRCSPGPLGRRWRSPTGLAALALAVCLLACACSTSAPQPISQQELTEAETFPYYTTYWVGKRFESFPLTAADGRMTYNPASGDSVYYGGCLHTGKILPSSSCVLPLQVTTAIYELHTNQRLGTQRNTVIRGVPATVYDKGSSIILYSGRMDIEVFSNTAANAMRATGLLRPMNAPGSASAPLPSPVYCPDLSGPWPGDVTRVMEDLPREVCQQTARAKGNQERMEREKH